MSNSPRSTGSAQFAIEAFASPAILVRVLQPLAKLDLMPTRLDAHTAGEHVVIHLEIAGVSAEWLRKIANALRQLPDVRAVVTAEPRPQAVEA
ncbi:MAG: hypothetical protein FJX65_13515 [Alphaproteobacteria bacterium]|nr:hypothetical protein [Alphaproteobacteria bacterium]